MGWRLHLFTLLVLVGAIVVAYSVLTRQVGGFEAYTTGLVTGLALVGVASMYRLERESRPPFDMRQS